MRNLLLAGLCVSMFAPIMAHAHGRKLAQADQSHVVAATAAAVRGEAADGNRYSGTPETRSLVESGDAALQAGKVEEAIKDYKKAIDLDPRYAEAQQKYVSTYGGKYVNLLTGGAVVMTQSYPKAVLDAADKKDKAIQRQLADTYTSLVAQHPENPVYPWILGSFYDETDLARQESLCEAAVGIDANFARGWECLAHLAMLHGDKAAAITDLRRAMTLLPDDQEVAGKYAGYLVSDGQYSTAPIRALLRRFPRSLGVAASAVDGANGLEPESARVEALEALLQDAPDPASNLAIFAAMDLYSIYLNTDLTKAKHLALQMGGPGNTSKVWSKIWDGRVLFVDGLIRAQHDLEAGHAQAAIATLKSIQGSRANSTREGVVRWNLMYAEALDAASRTVDAVRVLQQAFVANPSDRVLNAIYTYGAKVGQSKSESEEAIWTALRAKAKPAHSFTLQRLDGNGKVSLSDYRGKPVIVDFWYPNCGPCRASFPYLQQVAAKFKSQGLTVLAVNGVQAQQPLALPYLRGNRYDFIGLAGNEKFASSAYGVEGFPDTFFIGPAGNVLFNIEVSDDSSRRMAEAAVKFMLTRTR